MASSAACTAVLNKLSEAVFKALRYLVPLTNPSVNLVADSKLSTSTAFPSTISVFLTTLCTLFAGRLEVMSAIARKAARPSSDAPLANSLTALDSALLTARYLNIFLADPRFSKPACASSCFPSALPIANSPAPAIVLLSA